MQPARRLLLLGAGHAHLKALRRLASRRPPRWEILLVSNAAEQPYSGMVSGVVAGQYHPSELLVDLRRLCAQLHVELVVDEAVRLGVDLRSIWTKQGRQLEADLVSVNVGAGVAGNDLPGVAEHALRIKPLRHFLQHVDAGRGELNAPVVIVGGGAAAAELALALSARGLKSLTLIGSAAEVPAGAGPALARVVRRQLVARSITVRTGARVVAVMPDHVLLEDGVAVPARQVLWITGPCAPPLLRGCGAAVDAEGYLRVSTQLRSVSHDWLYGAGDAVSVEGHALPRSGVYSVRQAGTLGANLLGAMNERPPHATFRPQRHALAILNAGDGTGIAARGGVVVKGRAALWLKDWLDRRWMAQFPRARFRSPPKTR